jgi:hypothetical protein
MIDSVILLCGDLIYFEKTLSRKDRQCHSIFVIHSFANRDSCKSCSEAVAIRVK